MNRMDEMSVEVGTLRKELSIAMNMLMQMEFDRAPITPPPSQIDSPDAPLKRSDAKTGQEMRAQLRAEEQLDEERGSSRAKKMAKMAVSEEVAPSLMRQFCMTCLVETLFKREPGHRGGLEIWKCNNAGCGQKISFF